MTYSCITFLRREGLLEEFKALWPELRWMRHSDRWSRIYDWLHEKEIILPSEIETQLTEYYENEVL